MKSFRISTAADADLRNIASYTNATWGLSKRNAYLKALFDAFQTLADSPDIAMRIDHVRDGYRKFPQGSHVIYFRSGSKAQIEIIRILHKSMDVEDQLRSS